MISYGLIGYPLSHSFSKKYFKERFEKEGRNDYRYENFALASINELPGLLQSEISLKGFNITIPYKEQVIPFLDFKNEVVTAIGACNCVKIQDQLLYGYNTDVIGFEVTLKKGLKPHHDKALILGSGGAAKAVEYVMRKLGIDYFVVSRRAGGEEKHLLHYDDVSAEVLSTHTLLINTTPLGMHPKTETFPAINYDAITSRHYCYDLVYNPEKTVFLQKAESRGAVTRNGFEMLIVQAEESWKIWNNPQEVF